MELQLYFYHQEIDKTPAEIFRTIDSDEALLKGIEKLTDIEYIGGALNSREAGTRGILRYGNSPVEIEITSYTKNRRIDLKMEITAGTLITMFNIVPVEDRSEVTISTKLLTDSPATFAVYALKIPRIKKQFNENMKRLDEN
ncbi:hypothetical protein GCM10007275_20920 [Jeotgalicoccus coquinae]|uniref:Polyketide cyclase / dehydrase and lipid transport n=1 Tax=Jeotgalicoccus coquinae TaxID=709509 RepID=A0A6V7RRH0_9STAP|nr:hypothetical protein [Jeotgalicoccus coquinae]MBB6424204.1 hypothetical protein [Jeotgalicoccus coquinae]GGE25633.1 hypothetical protein GCM10007275_20920 [Jeotgalicoccus coquinae]CAD2081525.1 Polyketide cyclase / dehydrase and lipid transport [Jeotgalicoccus coquinae]